MAASVNNADSQVPRDSVPSPCTLPTVPEPLWSPEHNDEQSLFVMEVYESMLLPQTPQLPPSCPTLHTPRGVTGIMTSLPPSPMEEDKEMASRPELLLVKGQDSSPLPCPLQIPMWSK